jgi:hypothetical protein
MAMILKKAPMFPHDPAGPTAWLGPVRRVFFRILPFLPCAPIFPPSGPADGSCNGFHPGTKFLTVRGLRASLDRPMALSTAVVLLFSFSFISPGICHAQDDSASERKLEQLEKQIQKEIDSGRVPSAETMQEIQKIMDEMQKNMQDVEAEAEQDDPADRWVQVPYTGHFNISRSIRYKGPFVRTDSDARQDLSVSNKLTAVVTDCRTLRDKAGEIIGYQPVGNVQGTWDESDVVTGEDFVMTSKFNDQNREAHAFDPTRISGWCVLEVNPARRKYRLRLPSISPRKDSVTTIAETQGFKKKENTGVSFKCIRGYLKDAESKVENRDYTPGTSSIRGTEHHTRIMVVPSVVNPVAEMERAELLPEETSDGFLVKVPVSYDISWNLQIGAPKAKVVLEPEPGYDKWMPQLPMGTGNMIKIKARIEEPAGASGRFEFKLEDVSTEPGVCMNYPFEDADDTLDLTIAPVRTGMVFGGDGQTAKTETDMTEATVMVQVRDWGAYGKISATARLVIGGEEIEVQAVAKKSGEPYVSIPKDENNNSIADAWEEQNGVYPCAGDADEDDTPEGKCNGDGLSAYEEYRGFFIRGFQQRLNPKKKDLFVYDPDSLAQQSNLASATQLEVHYPIDKESHCTGSSDRIINFNKDRYHVIDQHCLWVKKKAHGTPDPFNWGECEGGAEIGPPRTADKYVLVFANQIREDITSVFQKNKLKITNTLGQRGIRPDAAWLEAQVQAAIGMVTTHEACHGIGVSHHYKSLRLTLPKGQDIEEAIMSGDISPSTGQMSCVMRYVWDGSKHPRITIHAEDELLAILCGRPWANTLCGPGGFDDCRSQMVVSDAEQGQTFE